MGTLEMSILRSSGALRFIESDKVLEKVAASLCRKDRHS